MKKIILAVVFTSMTLGAITAEGYYKKFTDKIDSIDEQVVEQKITETVESFVSEIEDFENDISAPKEKQSTFARFFNYLNELPLAGGVEVDPEYTQKVGAYTDGR